MNDPQRGRRFLATWLAVYPTLLVISLLITPTDSDLVLPLQLAISSLLLTATLTWAIMLCLTQALRPWLLDPSRR